MDLRILARNKIKLTAPGSHVAGLEAVLSHIDAAVGHLERGQNSRDDTAYTDAIYRTNQAFEGSLKEAYRVVAGKDPTKPTLQAIEDYFSSNERFRPRIISQLRYYRQEWRNPSTHDYKLDFDSNEALHAIVTVSAFAIMMLDQIIEYISMAKEKEATDRNEKTVDVVNSIKESRSDFRKYTVDVLASYIQRPYVGDERMPVSESELLGSIKGYFESIAPDVKVQTNGYTVQDVDVITDLWLHRGNDSILVEVKTGMNSTVTIQGGIEQLDIISSRTNIRNSILITTLDALFVNIQEIETENNNVVTVISAKELSDGLGKETAS